MVNKLTKAEIHKLEEEKLEKLKEITWENRMDDGNIVAFDLKELPHIEDDWDEFVDSLLPEFVILFTGTAILSNNPDAPISRYQNTLRSLLCVHIDALYRMYSRNEMVENFFKSMDEAQLRNLSLKGKKRH